MRVSIIVVRISIIVDPFRNFLQNYFDDSRVQSIIQIRQDSRSLTISLMSAEIKDVDVVLINRENTLCV